MLDEYEPGMTVRQAAALFDALRGELVQLVGTVGFRAGRIFRSSIVLLKRPSSWEAVAAAVGFDFRRGRLDAD